MYHKLRRNFTPCSPSRDPLRWYYGICQTVHLFLPSFLGVLKISVSNALLPLSLFKRKKSARIVFFQVLWVLIPTKFNPAYSVPSMFSSAPNCSSCIFPYYHSGSLILLSHIFRGGIVATHLSQFYPPRPSRECSASSEFSRSLINQLFGDKHSFQSP